MHKCDEGIATGGRDGLVQLWDFNVDKPTKINLKDSPYGYEGIPQLLILLLMHQIFSFVSLCIRRGLIWWYSVPG